VTAPVQQPYPGDKNTIPLVACVQRGDDKQPRFYPIAEGANNSAHALISPNAAVTPPLSIFAHKDVAAPRVMSGKNGMPPPPAETGFVIAQRSEALHLITERQSDGIARSPALTASQAERVAADSTRRYFHARDFHEQPFLSSNRHYEDDAAAMTEAKEVTKAAKSVSISKFP